MIYRGKVTRADEIGTFVEIADLGVGVVFGPCEVVYGPLLVDDFALCVQVSGAKEDIVIVGPLTAPEQVVI